MLKGILPPVFHKKYWRDIMYSRGQAVDYCDLGSHIRDAAAGNPHRGRYRHVPGTIHAQHTAGGAGGGAGAAAPSRSRAHHAKAAKPLNHGAALARSTEPIETTTRGRRDTAAIKLQQALDEVAQLRHQKEQLERELATAKDAKWRRGWQDAVVAPVYNTEKMREIHEDIVQTLVVVAIEHADAMLNAKATLPSGREVWFAVHDVQEYLETLVALCAACVASIESNFNDRFENAALDMVKTLAADSCEAVEAVQEVVHSAHKGLSKRLLKGIPEQVVDFPACANGVLQEWIKRRKLDLYWPAITNRDGEDTVYAEAVCLTSSIIKLLWWGEVMRRGASAGTPSCRLATEQWLVGNHVNSVLFMDSCEVTATQRFNGAMPDKADTLPHACILFPPLVEERTILAATSHTPTLDSQVVAKGLACRSRSPPPPVAVTTQDPGHGGSGYSSNDEASAGACSDVSEASRIHDV